VSISHLSQSVFLQFQRLRPAMPARCRGLGDNAGAALVELALMLSLLGVPLLLGTTYFAVLLLDNVEVSNAAHTGAMYGMTSSTFAEDSAGIIGAAQAETSRFGSNLSVTPSVYYACSNALGGTQYTTQAAANAACTGGSSYALQFVRVLVSASVTPPGKFPGFPKTFILKSVSIMQVEE
jgi:Flp pilus assembly protein TadG